MSLGKKGKLFLLLVKVASCLLYLVSGLRELTPSRRVVVSGRLLFLTHEKRHSCQSFYFQIDFCPETASELKREERERDAQAPGASGSIALSLLCRNARAISTHYSSFDTLATGSCDRYRAV